MVARSAVLTRAATIWPTGGVPYSQSTIHQPDGYRQDCSGFLSLCWAIPAGQWGGENTESLVGEGWMVEIPTDQLQPGDAVGMCGPGTLGNAGHIQLFDGWTTGGLVIWEQAGGTWGPTHRTIKRITPGYKAYRFTGIGEEDNMTPEQDRQFEVDAGRIEALVMMKPEVTYGPTAGEATWMVQALIGIQNDVAAIKATLAAGGGSGIGPSVDEIRAVVDEELDEQSRAGADAD